MHTNKNEKDLKNLVVKSLKLNETKIEITDDTIILEYKKK
jgi:hypothetical protein